MTDTATHTAKGLAEATRRIIALQEELAAEERRHKTATATLEGRISTAQHQRDLVLAGASLDVVELAETLLVVRGRENAGVGEGPKAIMDAIDALAHGLVTFYPNGSPRIDLRSRYVGTKNYDRWNGQRDDGDYGTAPSHGSTIFSIGVHEAYRNRALGAKPGGYEGGQKPSDDQIDAAIAYLHALLRGAS